VGLGQWTATTSFVGVRTTNETTAAYNGYLYLAGGVDLWTGCGICSFLNDVQMAPINSDGTLGSWAATTALPSGASGALVANNGYLYNVAGFVTGPSGATTDAVLVAPINTNGTLGAWAATANLPAARGNHASVVNNGFLYVIGGWSLSTGSLDGVLVAPINANGTLGTWVVTTSLPAGRSGHEAVAHNGYLYVVGGYDSYFNDVQMAPVNANGTLGSWTSVGTFSPGRAYTASVAHNDFLYVMGGVSPAVLSDVQLAPIRSNGTLGPFVPLSGFPGPRATHSGVAYNGFLYVLGGNSAAANGAFLDDVWMVRLP
jgi:N-acetylneuraminic acid mutarotase